MARAAAAYYAAGDPFGRGGDFTTAPEISQAFGECLGLWAAVCWQQMGAPARVVLAELGPGRGTLMADALRAVREMVPGFAAAARLHLVETSPRLRAMQAGRLPHATWLDRPEELPDGPLILVANEFLDALPIRQFVGQGGGWAERWVREGAFLLRPAPDVPADIRALPPRDGAVREASEPARALAGWLGARLVRSPGVALFIDYGPAGGGEGDSLQAVRAHAPVDPLADPGRADLTAHVDFAAFGAAGRAAGAAVHGPLPQGVFLRRLGLTQRAAMLAAANPRQAPAQLAAAQRLTAQEAMGHLFKAMALASPTLPAPPGFEAA
ncbi:SAM-dependent methyltransferase [Roseomonas sp. OT10]|uniref:class I SAM-dependent methyltransferase n=1 Tax=Roseomonas cutis TaxID=2897332 RepID=UPI001E5C5D47|nr:SAM-dependent methyltransferase [Roseomonas sp. OT10]UFN51410.1 SAM-dependent methyltransferase [Roseomonas sp. OT10]